VGDHFPRLPLASGRRCKRRRSAHASFGLVLGPYTAVVGVNDSTTYCQAETSALRAVGGATGKFVETARFIARSETGAHGRPVLAEALTESTTKRRSEMHRPCPRSTNVRLTCVR
jgi:maltooligosyltrehalose synthase